MKTPLPLAALQSQQHFTPTIQVTEPFRIFLILKMCPKIIIQFQKPIKAFLISGQLIALEHRNCRLNVHPPEFLIPFKLLLRSALDVKEVEYSAVLLVPSAFYDPQRDFN